MVKFFFSTAALLAGLAVMLGAWGAHGGEKIFTPEQMHTFQKAVRYQMHHSLALFAIAWALVQWPGNSFLLSTAGILLLMGMLLFSGSLYLITLTTLNPGLITPIGGMAMIGGWFLLAAAVWRG